MRTTHDNGYILIITLFYLFVLGELTEFGFFLALRTIASFHVVAYDFTTKLAGMNFS